MWIIIKFQFIHVSVHDEFYLNTISADSTVQIAFECTEKFKSKKGNISLLYLRLFSGNERL